jgi:ribosomal-protein-alanine N-acetyltransferase
MFDFSNFPTLTTERLLLRELTHEDAAAIMAIYGSPEALRYLNIEPVDTSEKAVGMIDWFKENFRNRVGIQWAIILKDNDQLIGSCGIYGWDQENRKLDIGYQIEPSYWSKGYATEATHAMLRWSFDHLNVHRIQADCTDGNIASEKVLLKCGFKVEGLWRESCWEHGRFVDIKQFGLLRREYP